MQTRTLIGRCALAFRAGMAVLVWLVFAAAQGVRAEELSESYRNALVAYKSDHYDEAMSEVGKSVAESPKEARPYLLRGRIQAALHHYPEAEQDFRAALKLDHSSSLAYLFLGDLFYQQRNFHDAWVNYSTYHHQSPEDADGTLKLVYCALGSQKIGEAQRLADSLNLFDEKNPAAYFAKAAVARALEKEPTGKESGDAPVSEPARLLHQAELLYGHLVYTAYIQDYLLLVAATGKG